MAEHAQFLWSNTLSEVRRNVSPGKHPPCGNVKRDGKGSLGSAEVGDICLRPPRVQKLEYTEAPGGPRQRAFLDLASLGTFQ